MQANFLARHVYLRNSLDCFSCENICIQFLLAGVISDLLINPSTNSNFRPLWSFSPATTTAGLHHPTIHLTQRHGLLSANLLENGGQAYSVWPQNSVFRALLSATNTFL